MGGQTVVLLAVIAQLQRTQTAELWSQLRVPQSQSGSPRRHRRLRSKPATGQAHGANKGVSARWRGGEGGGEVGEWLREWASLFARRAKAMCGSSSMSEPRHTHENASICEGESARKRSKARVQRERTCARQLSGSRTFLTTHGLTKDKPKDSGVRTHGAEENLNGLRIRFSVSEHVFQPRNQETLPNKLFLSHITHPFCLSLAYPLPIPLHLILHPSHLSMPRRPRRPWTESAPEKLRLELIREERGREREERKERPRGKRRTPGTRKA